MPFLSFLISRRPFFFTTAPTNNGSLSFFSCPLSDRGECDSLFPVKVIAYELPLAAYRSTGFLFFFLLPSLASADQTPFFSTWRYEIPFLPTATDRASPFHFACAKTPPFPFSSPLGNSSPFFARLRRIASFFSDKALSAHLRPTYRWTSDAAFSLSASPSSICYKKSLFLCTWSRGTIFFPPIHRLRVVTRRRSTREDVRSPLFPPPPL